MKATMPQLLNHIDALYALHEKHECVWADFFAACKDRINKDVAFGCDFLMAAYGGMFAYEEFGVLANDNDEAQRLKLAEETYQIAKELKTNDQN